MSTLRSPAHRVVLVRDYREDTDPEGKTRGRRRVRGWTWLVLAVLCVCAVYGTFFADWDFSPPPPGVISAPASSASGSASAPASSATTEAPLVASSGNFVGLGVMQPGTEQTLRIKASVATVGSLAFSIATVPRPLSSAEPNNPALQRNGALQGSRLAQPR